jgi:hypothetical protein
MFNKSIFSPFKLIIFVVIVAVNFISCTKEEEESTPIDETTITGEWKCNDSESENGLYDAQSFTIDISKNTTIYTIANFGNLGINAEVSAAVSGSNITVSEQTVDDISVHGSGTFTNNNKTVNFTYYLDNEKIESVWNKN